MPDPEVQDVSQPKKGFSPLILIVIALIILLLSGGGFLFLTMKSSATTKDVSSQEKKENEKKKPGIFYNFDDAFIVNLAEVNAERYLKVTPVLELDNEDVIEEINQKLPQVKDILISIFSSKGLDEVMPLAGKERLKQEIIDKVNEILSKGKIIGVYFSEFVIQ